MKVVTGLLVVICVIFIVYYFNSIKFSSYEPLQWTEKSGNHFEKVALCNSGKEKAPEEKIEEIEKSAFSEGRIKDQDI